MTNFEKWRDSLTVEKLYDIMCDLDDCVRFYPDTDICADCECTLEKFSAWANKTEEETQ